MNIRRARLCEGCKAEQRAFLKDQLHVIRLNIQILEAEGKAIIAGFTEPETTSQK